MLMANHTWSENVLQLLHRMNNFYSAGSCRAVCSSFQVDGVQVGWIRPAVVSLLHQYPEVFKRTEGDTVSLCPHLDSYGSRSEAVDEVLRSLRKDSTVMCLRGWRDEKYSVMPRFSDHPVMWMERAATSLFGIKRYGVHVNGYTVGQGGDISMWVARRSATKQTYPGVLDNMAAGGIAAGVTVKQTLVKECYEEARVPEALAEKARPVNTVSYTYEEEDSVFAETQFVFDLKLPLDFKPTVGDGEVQEFYHLPVHKVKEVLATDDFKPNSAMVVLDFLIRHSIIDPDTEPWYQQLVAGLHQTLE